MEALHKFRYMAEKQEAVKKFIEDYPDRNPKLEEAQQMLERMVPDEY